MMAGGFGYLRDWNSFSDNYGHFVQITVWSHYYPNYIGIRSTLSISICPVRFLSMKIILSELHLL